MAQHVLVFHDDHALRALCTELCDFAGYAVTTVSDMEDALMVLRTSLHPVVAIVERDHSSMHLMGSFFQIISDHPQWYAQHRYIALGVWPLSPEDEGLLRTLNVTVLKLPFRGEDLMDIVAQTAVSL